MLKQLGGCGWFLIAVTFSSSCGDGGSGSVSTVRSGRCEITSAVSDETYTFCHYFGDWPVTALEQAKADCASGEDLGGSGTWTEHPDAGQVNCPVSNMLGHCTWSTTYRIDTTYTAIPSGQSGPNHCASTWGGAWSAS